MNALGHLRIGTRLGLCFGIVLLLLVAAVATGAYRLQTLNDNLVYLNDNTVPSLRIAADIRTSIDTMRRWEYRAAMIDTEAQAKTVAESLAKMRADYERGLADYANVVADDQDRQLLETVKRLGADYLANGETLAQLTRRVTTDPKAVGELKHHLFETSYQSFQQFSKAIDDLWAYKVKLAEAREAASQRDYSTALVVLGALGALSLLFGIVAALVITRSIVVPLKSAIEIAGHVANGDLARTIHAKHRDETGDLIASLREMQGRLRTTVTSIRDASESVSTASVQIAQGNQDLSGRTEQQASSLQETAASMEEMASTVQANADAAAQASDLASGAAEQANAGADTIGRVEAVMNEITESSRRISDIIGVIDGIAFQTNILALNAAVEAARAGEQGRGFAVVASEVRTLAQRSAEAAKDIKGLIGESATKVGEGANLVGAAVQAMRQIRESVHNVSTILDASKASAAEQSAGIQQVNTAVNQLDEMTQQNAALVEESTAAATSLREQASRLIDAIAIFRTDGTLADAPARVAPVARPRAQAAAKPAARAQAKPQARANAARTAVPAPARSAAAKPAEGAAAPAAKVPTVVAAAAARSQAAAAPLATPAPAKARATTASDDDWEEF